METIVLTSDANDMTIYITPVKSNQVETIKNIATKAYDAWFACDGTDDFMYFSATGDYVIAMLEEAGFEEGIDYTIEFGDDWD